MDNPGWEFYKNSAQSGLPTGVIWRLSGEQPLGQILRECHNSDTPVLLFGEPKTELAACLEINFLERGLHRTSHLLRFIKSPPKQQIASPGLQGRQ